ncbi:MAG: carboxypeptidase regulatory-like domain-containing protein [Gemmatimonadetes bacterium]|nr:carboxypeptidase regulatory-like domain-containing protein [Gemmatimonadota bacterium]
MRCALPVTLALCLVGGGAWAQAPQSIIVYGAVRNAAGIALAGVEVRIEGTALRIMTSESGEYHLDSVPSGRVTVTARHPGFHPDTKRVTLRPGDTKKVLFTLEGIPEALDQVLITARMDSAVRLREFWGRRMLGLGVFLTREDIEKRRAQHSFSLFQGIAGIQVVTMGGEPTKLVTTRRAATPARLRSAPGAECPMQYYVDGVFMSAEMFSIDELTPDMIEAVEVFRGPSEVPVQFRQTDVDCGLVVIWTREPPRPTKPER